MLEKQKNDVSLFRKYVAETALFLAATSLVLGLLFYVLVARNPTRIYWLHVFYYQRTVLLGCEVVPIFSLVVVIIASLFRYRAAILTITVVLMMFACMLFSYAALPAGLVDYIRAASVSAGSYVYRADFDERRVPGGMKGDIYLYRCDGLSLLCDQIFSQRYDPMEYYRGEKNSRLQVSLAVEQGKVVLSIEGEVLYEEQP
jgi:hypothetical protein